jgi:hypothetical protein
MQVRPAGHVTPEAAAVYLSRRLIMRLVFFHPLLGVWRLSDPFIVYLDAPREQDHTGQYV